MYTWSRGIKKIVFHLLCPSIGCAFAIENKLWVYEYFIFSLTLVALALSIVPIIDFVCCWLLYKQPNGQFAPLKGHTCILLFSYQKPYTIQLEWPRSWYLKHLSFLLSIDEWWQFCLRKHPTQDFIWLFWNLNYGNRPNLVFTLQIT